LVKCRESLGKFSFKNSSYVSKYAIIYNTISTASVGFVAAAVSMPMGGCRARRLRVVDVSVAAVAADIPIAAELAVL